MTKAEMITELSALGIYVPPSWTLERVQELYDDVSESAAAPPPPAWTPGSPRG